MKMGFGAHAQKMQEATREANRKLREAGITNNDAFNKAYKKYYESDDEND